MTTIAIDGPAGSGKSTVAKTLAEELDYTYIDTGAMYRACTLHILEQGIDPEREEDVVQTLRNVDIQLVGTPRNQRVYLGLRDVSDLIRSPEVSRMVSKVASYGGLRRLMVQKQRELARNGNVIMDGRDIGSYVLPAAQFKFFLTASLEERARRRMKDFSGMGHHVSLEDLMEEIRTRDWEDSTRKVSPLVQAEDAIQIDTTNDDVDGIIAKIRTIMGKQERIS